MYGAALEVGGDDAGRLRGPRAGPERPGPALLLARREVRAQPHELVGGVEEPGQGALAEAEAPEHPDPLLLGVERGRLRFALHAPAADLATPAEIGRAAWWGRRGQEVVTSVVG